MKKHLSRPYNDFYLIKISNHTVKRSILLLLCFYSFFVSGQNNFNRNDDIVTAQFDNYSESDCDTEVFDEVNGVVIIETENTSSDLGEWFEATEVEDFTGEGYLEFNGNRPQNGDPNSPLIYNFRINEPGLYFLHLRCARETLTIDGEERDDVANDCYVRVEGDYEEGPNVGNNHTDDASLETLMSDTKFFGGNDFEFVWASGSRLDLGGDTNKRRAVYNFKANETYTLVVSGRSQFFKLDRIMFRRESVNSGTAQNTNLTETYVECDEENEAPIVQITTPEDGSIFAIDEVIEIIADASDSDGTIEQVEFFVDGESIGIERLAAYDVLMEDYEIGMYTLTAISTDDQGLTTTSEPVTIEIVDVLGIEDIVDLKLDVVIYPNPTNDVLSIESNTEIQKAELFTLGGKKIKDNFTNSIDISSISTGLYLLNIYLENGKIITKKVIKK